MASNISINTTALGISWASGEVYRVVIDDGFVNQDGGLRIPVAGGLLTTFTTSAFPPKIGNSVPTHTTTAPIGIQDISFGIDRANLTILGGNVSLYQQASPNVLIKTVTVSNVVSQGNVVAMNVVGNLLASQTYFVTLTANIFQDRDGFRNNAVTNSSSFRFISPSAPSAYDSIPSNNTTAEKGFQKIDIIFDRTVTANIGNIYVYKANTNALVKTVSITSANVGNALIYAGGQYLSNASVNVVGVMEANEKYYVRANANIVQDATLIKSNFSGNIFTFTTPTSPFITSTSPSNNTQMAIDATGISLTFDRTITANIGNIYLFNANTNTLVKTYSINSGVTINDTVISLSVTGNITGNAYYTIRSNANIVQDATLIRSNISSGNIFTFQAPYPSQVIGQQPPNNAIASIDVTNVGFTVDRNVTKNTGNVYLYKANTNQLIKTYPISSNVSLSNNVDVTVSVADTLDANENYYLTTDSDILRDNLLIPFGVTTANTLNFTAPNGPGVISSNPPTETVANIGFRYANVTFDRNITSVSGNVYLRRYADSLLIKTFDLANLSITANTISANITGLVDGSVVYYLSSDDGIVKDISGCKNSALTSANLTFTTPTPPQIISTYPNTGNTSVLENQAIYFRLDRATSPITGNVYLKNNVDNSNVIITSAANLSIINSNVYINVGGKLNASTSYYVTTDANVLQDATGIKFSSISNPGTFNFTTSSSFSKDWPLVIGNITSVNATYVASTTAIPQLIIGTPYDSNNYRLNILTSGGIDDAFKNAASSISETISFNKLVVGDNTTATNSGGGGSTQQVSRWGGSGGGGAGSPGGGRGSNPYAGSSYGYPGGNGRQNDITGTNTYYAGGGGGGSSDQYNAPGGAGGLGGGGNGGYGNMNGYNATSGTGGGGGGASNSAALGSSPQTPASTRGGNGGSGIVVIRYPTSWGYAIGGTVTYLGGDTIHTFTSNGTFILSSTNNLIAEYLMVGGGGGGGSVSAQNNYGGAGGGGAGAMREGGMVIQPGTYDVYVGQGGIGGIVGGPPYLTNGNPGSPSAFNRLSAGGGFGGSTPLGWTIPLYPAAPSNGLNGPNPVGYSGFSGSGGGNGGFGGQAPTGGTTYNNIATIGNITITGNVSTINGLLGNLILTQNASSNNSKLYYQLTNGLGEISYREQTIGTTLVNNLIIYGASPGGGNANIVSSGNLTTGSGTSFYYPANKTYSFLTSSVATAVGTGNFTVEAWVYSTITSSNEKCIFETRPIGGSSAGWMFRNSGTDSFLLYANNTNFLTISNRINNQWQHIAIVRSAGVVYVYVDGILRNSAGLTTNFSSTFFRLGGFTDDSSTTQSYQGYIDSVRYSNVVRYGSNFAVPTGEYASDANTLLLLNAIGSNNSTAFIDQSAYNQFVVNGSNGGTLGTGSGNVVITTGAYRF